MAIATQQPACRARKMRTAFCDEAQRYNENKYEWLRDVHDVLDRQQMKLFTVLVGQQELLAQKSRLQIAGKTQIVARLSPG